MRNNLHLGSDVSVSVRVESSHDSRGVVGNTDTEGVSAIVGRDGEINSNGRCHYLMSMKIKLFRRATEEQREKS